MNVVLRFIEVGKLLSVRFGRVYVHTTPDNYRFADNAFKAMRHKNVYSLTGYDLFSVFRSKLNRLN